MTLPARSEVKADVLPLQRALRALKDARSSLKQFGKTGSLKADPALSESVNVLRGKVKKRENWPEELRGAGSKTPPTNAFHEIKLLASRMSAKTSRCSESLALILWSLRGKARPTAAQSSSLLER